MNNTSDRAMADSHLTSSLSDVRVIELPRHYHLNGSLTEVENGGKYPFEVRRVYYLYDVPADSERGGHSHIEANSLIIAVAGAFNVELDDGVSRKRWSLDRPYKALYVPAGLWRVIDGFTSGSVCLVLTSTEFSEEDYVRDYDEFLKLTAHKR